MVAGDPLRVEQGQRAGRDRNGFLHAENSLLRIACIDMNRDRAGIRFVLRRRHLRATRVLRNRVARHKHRRYGCGEGYTRERARRGRRRSGERGDRHHGVRQPSEGSANLAPSVAVMNSVDRLRKVGCRLTAISKTACEIERFVEPPQNQVAKFTRDTRRPCSIVDDRMRKSMRESTTSSVGSRVSNTEDGSLRDLTCDQPDSITRFSRHLDHDFAGHGICCLICV